MGRMRTVHRWAGDPTLTTHFHPPPGYLPLSSLLQALLKKHEVVMADVEAFGATIASLEEQSKKCKVCHTTHMPHAPPHPLTQTPHHTHMLPWYIFLPFPPPSGLPLSRHAGSSQASLCEGTLQLHQEDSQGANSEEGRHSLSDKLIKQGTAL